MYSYNGVEGTRENVFLKIVLFDDISIPPAGGKSIIVTRVSSEDVSRLYTTGLRITHWK